MFLSRDIDPIPTDPPSAGQKVCVSRLIVCHAVILNAFELFKLEQHHHHRQSERTWNIKTLRQVVRESRQEAASIAHTGSIASCFPTPRLLPALAICGVFWGGGVLKKKTHEIRSFLVEFQYIRRQNINETPSLCRVCSKWSRVRTRRFRVWQCLP